MRTTALRLYGKNDLRLESFELPAIKNDEILIRIISDSICMSTYKAAMQGSDHKRVPDHVEKNPVIVGHEFSAEIIEVGTKWQSQYQKGQRISLQPALKGTYDAAGYTFPYLGGDATYGIIPPIYMEQGNVLTFDGDAYFSASLSEPLSCVIGAVHACYHTKQGEYTHEMEIKDGGVAAILAGAGPMGLAMIDYMIHRDRHSAKIVVTDIDDARLMHAAEILSPKEAAKNGVELIYLNTKSMDDPVSELKILSGKCGYDEVFIFAPVPAVVQQGDAILGYDGCLNFFAGPTNPAFAAQFNFYNVHYNATHVVGTSGGNTDDMREALKLADQNRITPAILVTHIGGMDAASETILNLPHVPGGKKLIYTHISLPLTAIDDFAEKGKSDPLFAKLAELCAQTGGLWNVEAEKYLLQNARNLDI
ncbi:MAG TPA: zinc-binding dehydrogenase [Candidatus Limiplasma sp.]|nr:zinc-binding dehydrogenase [Candidatus Limiplasma sp.]